MKTLKRIVCIIIALYLGIYAPLKILNYILINDSRSYTRVMFHELYSQDENIDALFLGSSHCYRSLNPDIIDNIWMQNTFNGGTSSQNLDGSYIILKEAVKRNDIKEVYLEMFYTTMGSVYNARTEMTSTYIISDYLKPSFDKLYYMVTSIPKEHYLDAMIKARRNWKKAFEKDYINNLIRMKESKEYRNFQYVDNGNESYQGKGYVGNYTSIENDTFYQQEHFTPIRENRLSEDDIKYLRKIKNLCDKRDIKLTLFSSPMSNFRLCDVGNYDSYIDQVGSIANELEVEYYDFNLCKGKYLSLTSKDYYDDQHLNYAGAEKFSKCFAEFFRSDSKDRYFYSSYEEKMKNSLPELLGIITSKKDSLLTIEAIANKEVNVLYRIDVLKNKELFTYTGEDLIVSIPLEGDETVEIEFIDQDNKKELHATYLYNQ